MATEFATILHRRKSAAAWTSENRILKASEIGFETDTGKTKIGDGSTAWATLDYIGFGSGGDITTDAAWLAKGNLIVGTGAATAQILAIGANTYVLTADSSQTTGMKWAQSTGSGKPVLADNPTLTTPVLGDAVVTTVNKLTITTPATGSTLTIDDGFTLHASANATVSGTNTGDQTTVSGNAGTATILATGRTIAMTGDVTWTSPTFNGSGNVTAAGTIANGAVTLAKQADMATASVVYRKTAGSGAPEVNTLATLKTDLGLTGTNSGDQTTVSGNAGSATVLQTARAINGTNFDGSAAITITSAAGTLTGATLNATVTASSLTSVGVLVGGSTGAGFTIALTTSTITGTLPAAQMPALTGDVTTVAGAVASTIAAGAVTLAKTATAAKTNTITATFGDGVNVIPANVEVRLPDLPTGGTITFTSIISDVSSTSTFDILTASSNATPSFASIVGAGTAPTLTAAIAKVRTAPSGWTGTTWVATDMMKIVVLTNNNAKRITLSIEYTAS